MQCSCQGGISGRAPGQWGHDATYARLDIRGHGGVYNSHSLSNGNYRTLPGRRPVARGVGPQWVRAAKGGVPCAIPVHAANACGMRWQ